MKTGFIVCGALGREVKEIVRKRGWDASIIGVNPINHMYPLRIAPDVEKRIQSLKSRCDRVLVLFGECGTRGTLDAVIEKHNLFRIDAHNCYEMYAGKEYHSFVEEDHGTYFLTDFLVRTFHHSVIQGLGLDCYPELKNEYFHNCTRIVYLVQNDSPQLRKQAQSIADFMELPLSFHQTGCGKLEERILKLMNKEEHRNGLPSYRTSCCWKNSLGNESLMAC